MWWSPFAPFLTSAFQVTALDLSGHGDSDWREKYRIETWAEEVRTIARIASKDCGLAGAESKPRIVGHSLGAQVSLVAAAMSGDDIERVILCDISIPGEDHRTRSARYFQNWVLYPTREAAVGKFRLVPRQRCDNDYLLAHIAENSVREVSAVTHRRDGWTWKFDWRLFARTIDRWIGAYLTEITAPIAFLHGELSRVVTPDSSQRTSEILDRPAPVLWIPQARHHLMLDQPIAFVTALRALLAG